LIFSLLVEGYVLWIAFKTIKKDSKDKPFWPYVLHEADSSVVAVLMEDAAACLGILIAFAALVLTQITGHGYWDAIGSILVGILLGWIAIWLTHRNRNLLIGQSIPQKDLDTLMTVLNQNEFVDEIDHIHTEVIGVDQYEAQIEADFDELLLVRSVKMDLKTAYQSIQSEADFIAFCEQYGILCVEHVKEKIDELEAEIKAKIPQVDYIDIEPN
jgi:zinc transporter 9